MEKQIKGDYISMFSSPIFIGKTSKDISPLLIECKEQQKKYPEGVVKTNRGGWQSNFIDSNILSDYVLDKVNSVAYDWGFESRLQIENSWFNVNQSGDYNDSHYHASSILSGVLYLKCPKNSGSIFFENPSYGLLESYIQPYIKYRKNRLTSFSFSYSPEESGLIIFPSWIRHKVDPGQFDGERISISFNTTVVYCNVGGLKLVNEFQK
jgi:uncharacterized protein (TIGR02466 family)